MNRRRVMLGLGSIIATPLAAHAQQRDLMLVGVLSGGSPAPYMRHAAAFRQALAEAGFVEGKSITIEFRWAEGRYDVLPDMAADLVREQVALIAAMTIPAAEAAKNATRTIPIVFYLGGDPVEAGLVARFPRPGGNVTGVSSLNARLNGKRLGLLRDLVTAVPRVGLLVNPSNSNVQAQIDDTNQAARESSTTIITMSARNVAEIDDAFAQAKTMSGLIVGADPFFNVSRNRLVSLAAKYSVPTIYFDREFAVAGGLLSYGTGLVDAWRQVGVYAGKILAGAKPGDLPVVQPTKFELVINLKTAKELGLTVPPILLVQADEIIE